MLPNLVICIANEWADGMLCHSVADAGCRRRCRHPCKWCYTYSFVCLLRRTCARCRTRVLSVCRARIEARCFCLWQLREKAGMHTYFRESLFLNYYWVPGVVANIMPPVCALIAYCKIQLNTQLRLLLFAVLRSLELQLFICLYFIPKSLYSMPRALVQVPFLLLMVYERILMVRIEPERVVCFLTFCIDAPLINWWRVNYFRRTECWLLTSIFCCYSHSQLWVIYDCYESTQIFRGMWVQCVDPKLELIELLPYADCCIMNIYISLLYNDRNQSPTFIDLAINISSQSIQIYVAECCFLYCSVIM